MDMWSRSSFDNSGKKETILTDPQNEVYVRMDGKMVYNGNRYTGDVGNNTLGSIKIYKND
jgi:hypothetical protein